MSTDVPVIAPNNTGDVLYSIRSAKPVRSDFWHDMGALVNWILGHGATLVSAHCPSHAVVAAGSDESFYYRIRQPAVQSYAVYPVHMWIFRIAGTMLNTDQASTGNITVSHSGGVDEATVNWSISGGVPGTIILQQAITNAVADASTSVVVNFDCDTGSSTGAIIEEIMCVALPRACMGNPDMTMGVDLNSLQPKKPIYAASSAYAVTRQSVKAVHNGLYYALWATDRTLFSWSGKEHVETATSETDMFCHSPEMVSRLLLDGVNYRAAMFRVIAHADAGNIGGYIKAHSNATGNTVTIAITNTAYAWFSDSLAIGVEDLTEDDNRRFADHTVDIKCCANSGGSVYIKGISVHEDCENLG
jgi:hypothetical protein